MMNISSERLISELNEVLAMTSRLNTGYFPQMEEDSNFIDHCDMALDSAYRLAQMHVTLWEQTGVIQTQFVRGLYIPYERVFKGRAYYETKLAFVENVCSWIKAKIRVDEIAAKLSAELKWGDECEPLVVRDLERRLIKAEKYFASSMPKRGES